MESHALAGGSRPAYGSGTLASARGTGAWSVCRASSTESVRAAISASRSTGTTASMMPRAWRFSATWTPSGNGRP
ncbi:MAG: hypothetical protein BWY91_03335 [bacterium ADurb.BinA028]|nr:MAG: hypothetical protein BWY91_03335 [bacterium ADurb.BinA028]